MVAGGDGRQTPARQLQAPESATSKRQKQGKGGGRDALPWEALAAAATVRGGLTAAVAAAPDGAAGDVGPSREGGAGRGGGEGVGGDGGALGSGGGRCG